MRPFRACYLAAAIGGILLAGPAAAAPDQTQGVAIMAAFVFGGGLLQSGVGVASSDQTDTGTYEVTFRRKINLDDCFFFANTPSPLFIAHVNGLIINEETIVVLIRDKNGDPADGAFQLLAFCAR